MSESPFVTSHSVSSVHSLNIPAALGGIRNTLWASSQWTPIPVHNRRCLSDEWLILPVLWSDKVKLQSFGITLAMAILCLQRPWTMHPYKPFKKKRGFIICSDMFLVDCLHYCNFANYTNQIHIHFILFNKRIFCVL